MIYFFEIKWRKKHNKPLNKGKPIYGGQYLGFWMLGSIFVQIFVFSIVLFLEKYWQKKPVVLKNAFPNFVDPITPDELAGLAMESEVDSRLVRQTHGEWQAI